MKYQPFKNTNELIIGYFDGWILLMTIFIEVSLNLDKLPYSIYGMRNIL